MVDVTKKVVVGKTVKYDRLLKQQKQTMMGRTLGVTGYCSPRP